MGPRAARQVCNLGCSGASGLQRASGAQLTLPRRGSSLRRPPPGALLSSSNGLGLACVWRAEGASTALAAALLGSAGALKRGNRFRSATACSSTQIETAEELDPVQVDLDVDFHGRPSSETSTGAGKNGVPRPGRSSQAVVKVYSVKCSPMPSMPWVNRPQQDGVGTAFFVEDKGRRLLITNAHVVADAAFVEVRRAGDAEKYVATRVKVAHDCDLAALGVEDERFWQGMRPLQFGKMPHMQDKVSAVGYPEGGEGVSVTQGVVSRIEIQGYVHSGKQLLAVQIDAAINPGNSGGPALDEHGRVIGVAFQNQSKSQNIGYVIPIPIILHFLADEDPARPGRCRGFPSLGIKWQALENEQLRRYLGMSDGQTGVLINCTAPLAPVAGLLRPGDVMLELEGKIVANDGTFSTGHQERLNLQHLIHQKFHGEAVQVRLLREGKEVVLSVPVEALPVLVPSFLYDTPQPYFVYGGAAFVCLSAPYLREWGENWAQDCPHELKTLLLEGFQKVPEEHPVVLAHCFPSPRTAGYGNLIDQRVVAVNGEPVVNLQQMYELVCKLHESSGYLQFELHSRHGNQIIAIDAQTANEVSAGIMETYGIARAVSPHIQQWGSEERSVLEPQAGSAPSSSSSSSAR